MTVSTSDTAFLTLEKSFPYRGNREHFVNVYHFAETPPDNAAWQGLGDLVRSLENACFPATVQHERATGHIKGTPPVLVYEQDYAPAGEGGPAGAYVPIATEHLAPGDSAIWVRYGTTQKTSRGKPIYLRNYYHSIYYDTTADTFSARQKANFDSLGGFMVSGIAFGGITYHRAGPRGATAQNHATSAFITTRTLKARGKRKKSSVNVVKLSDFLPDIIGRL